MTLSSNPFSDVLGMWGFQWCEQTSQRNLHNYGWNVRECLSALIRRFESTLNCTGSLYCFLVFLIYVLFFGWAVSLLLHAGFLWLQWTGPTLHCGARASHCSGFSCCRIQALGRRLQQLWHTGLVAPQHVESSRTRDWTHVPCIGGQILIHCTTSEIHESVFPLCLAASTSQLHWEPPK